jgi:hypothetical protein
VAASSVSSLQIFLILVDGSIRCWRRGSVASSLEGRQQGWKEIAWKPARMEGVAAHHLWITFKWSVSGACVDGRVPGIEDG